MMLAMLERAGFRCFRPRGAYYIMADISGFGFADDVQFARHLIENVGIAAVPGSSFFFHPEEGATLIRFCFCKKYETLKVADERLLTNWLSVCEADQPRGGGFDEESPCSRSLTPGIGGPPGWNGPGNRPGETAARRCC